MSDTPPAEDPETPSPEPSEAASSKRGLITFVILAVLFGGAKIARRVFKAAKHTPTSVGKHADELADGGRAVAREADAARHAGGDGVGVMETLGEAKDAHDVTDVGGKVADALSDGEEPAFEDAAPFLELLADEEPATRVMGAEQLGTIRCDPDAIEALAEALGDPAQEVRCAAAQSLGLQGALAQTAKPALEEAAESGDAKLEATCRTALRQIDEATR